MKTIFNFNQNRPSHAGNLSLLLQLIMPSRLLMLCLGLLYKLFFIIIYSHLLLDYCLIRPVDAKVEKGEFIFFGGIYTIVSHSSLRSRDSCNRPVSYNLSNRQYLHVLFSADKTTRKNPNGQKGVGTGNSLKNYFQINKVQLVAKRARCSTLSIFCISFLDLLIKKTMTYSAHYSCNKLRDVKNT